MRKSREEAAETRRRIVTAASAEFREKGIIATGLADLMKAAGLTHGGFYTHFESKDQVIAEACAEAVAGTLSGMESDALGRPGRDGLDAIAGAYLSPDHRDDVRDGCPLSALGSELARSDEATRREMTAGLRRMVDIIAARLDPKHPERARRRAMAAASAMIGALTMSRMVSDPAFSDDLLAAAKEFVSKP